MESLDNNAVEVSMAEIDDGLPLFPLFEDIQLLGMIEGIVDFADTAEEFTAIISAGILLALFIYSMVYCGTGTAKR